MYDVYRRSLRCGAINGAAKTYMQSTSTEPGSALEGLLLDLARVAQRASEELGPCSEKKLAEHAVKARSWSVRGAMQGTVILPRVTGPPCEIYGINVYNICIYIWFRISTLELTLLFPCSERGFGARGS